MKRIPALVFILVLTLSGVGIWRHTHRFDRQVAVARSLVGTHTGAALLKQLNDEFPREAEVPFLLARQARHEGRYRDVASALDQAQKMNWPKAAIARERLLTLVCVDAKLAQADLERLLQANTTDAELMLAVAECRISMQRETDALELADRVLKLEPNSEAAHAVRGKAFLQLRRLDEAKAELEAAQPQDPDRIVPPRVHLDFATCLLERGEFAAAYDRFKIVRAADPASLIPVFGLGRCASYLTRYEEAAEAFRTILEQRPDHVETLLLMALVTEQQGKHADAIPYLERSLKLEPNRAETHSRLAKLYAIIGNDKQAADHEAKYHQIEAARLKNSSTKPESRP